MSKLEMHDWQIENEDAIIDRFLEDYEDERRKAFKEWKLKEKFYNGGTCGLGHTINKLYDESVDAQYEQYRDTEEAPEGEIIGHGDR